MASASDTNAPAAAAAAAAEDDDEDDDRATRNFLSPPSSSARDASLRLAPTAAAAASTRHTGDVMSGDVASAASRSRSLKKVGMSVSVSGSISEPREKACRSDGSRWRSSGGP